LATVRPNWFRLKELFCWSNTLSVKACWFLFAQDSFASM